MFHPQSSSFFEKCTVILTTGNLDKFTENSWDSIADIEFSNALKFLPYFFFFELVPHIFNSYPALQGKTISNQKVYTGSYPTPSGVFIVIFLMI